jgi:hypothetical protein
MKLSELIGPNRTLPANFDAKAYGLIFDATINAALLAAQPDGSLNRISPVQLIDGNWASSADVLTEATSGIFAPIFSQLSTELAAQVKVVNWDTVLALLPPRTATATTDELAAYITGPDYPVWPSEE